MLGPVSFRSYQPPNLAISTLYWKAWPLLLVVAAFNPENIGKWRRVAALNVVRFIVSQIRGGQICHYRSRLCIYLWAWSLPQRAYYLWNEWGC